ncbi:MAG: MerR family transcriptional regulator [Rhodoglobus sp.]|nr:MerR family transcriptional regulator [Rhodoglobus sp.]
MKISELCQVSGVPLPSIKYYLREGLLPPGERLASNQASYTQEHVERLKLIRALIEVGGLPIATAQRVIAAVDDKELPLSYVFGVAQYAISDSSLYTEVDADSPGLERVDALIAELGWAVHPESPARHAAARVLDTLAGLGQEGPAQFLAEYAAAAERIARADLATVGLSTEVADMAETVVVGTVLGDALNAALRRMAQEHVSYQVYPAPRSQS